MNTSACHIAVLVLNYNGLDHLRRLWESWENLSTREGFTMILVDNGSSDSSVSFTRSGYPGVQVIENNQNPGWGAGYNQAVDSLGADPPYTHYMFLNNDTVLSDSFMEEIRNAVVSAPDTVGEIGCRSVFLAPFVRETLFISIRPVTEGARLRHAGVKESHSRVDTAAGQVTVRCQPEPLTDSRPLPFPSPGDEPVQYHLCCHSEGEIEVELAPGLIVEAANERAEKPLYFIHGSIQHTESGNAQSGRKLRFSGVETFLRVLDASTDCARLIQNSGIRLQADGNAAEMGVLEELDWVQPADVDGVCGVCKVVRRDVYEALGGFDPMFFMYYEDIDFSLRLRRAGYTSRVADRAHLLHVHAGSSVEHSDFFNREVCWSWLYFMYKHGSIKQKTALGCYYLMWKIRHRLKKRESPHGLALRRFAETTGGPVRYMLGPRNGT